MKKILLLLPFLVSCGAKEVEWDATGLFEAIQIVVSSENNGTLTQLNVIEGEELTAGVVVGFIDTVQLHLQQQQLIASRDAALSSRADIATQIAVTKQQIEWQEKELKRFEKLFSQNSATQKQVDDLANQLSVTRRQLAAQQSSLTTTNRSITDQSKTIDVNIEAVKDRLLKSYIKSPITGRVLTKYMEQGEFVAVGKPLFSIADMNNIYLRAYVTADMLTKMKIGDSVKVYSDFGAEEQREYGGKVTWISDKAEFTAKSIQTRDERANLVYAVKISVVNDGYLKIGMYGQVKL